eukprot:1463447-Lingulodinium_polyedra.AAC.1
MASHGQANSKTHALQKVISHREHEAKVCGDMPPEFAGLFQMSQHDFQFSSAPGSWRSVWAIAAP